MLSPILFEYFPGDDYATLGGVFTRTTGAKYQNKAGRVADAAVGIIRDNDYYNQNTKRTTVFEGAPSQQNALLWSEDMGNAVWTNGGGVTVTINAQLAPDGINSSADQLNFTTTSATNFLQQQIAVANPANKLYVFSMWVLDGGSIGWGTDGILIQIRRGDGTQSLGFTKGAGTLKLTGETVTMGTLGWRRVYCLYQADATTNANIQVLIRSNSVTGIFYVWGIQLEDMSGTSIKAQVPTSYMMSNASVGARDADVLTYPFTYVPQAMTIYTRFIERGNYSINDSFVWNIGGASTPQLNIIHHLVGQCYIGRNIGGASVDTGTGALNIPTLNDVVEHLLILYADGSVELRQTINGAAEQTSGRSSALTMGIAWANPKLFIGANDSPGSFFSLMNLYAMRICAGNGINTISLARTPSSCILFKDTIGLAVLHNMKPFPADRFSGWTPDSIPVGASKQRLSDEQTFMFRTSDRNSLSLTVPGLPSRQPFADPNGYTPTDIATRLIYHLTNGGKCIVHTGDANNATYGPCAIAPGTKPQLSPSNKQLLENTLSLQLISVATTPQQFSLQHA